MKIKPCHERYLLHKQVLAIAYLTLAHHACPYFRFNPVGPSTAKVVESAIDMMRKLGVNGRFSLIG
jgi:hypothetical protein